MAKRKTTKKKTATKVGENPDLETEKAAHEVTKIALKEAIKEITELQKPKVKFEETKEKSSNEAFAMTSTYKPSMKSQN